MSDLVFDFDWSDPLGARGEELRATWARLAIRVDGRVPSRVHDQEVRTVREDIYVPLYPMAEWLVANWWRLLFEMESTERAKDPLYERRHNLGWAREGYSFPSLSFNPIGEQVQLRWESSCLPSHRIEFLDSGSAYLPLDRVEHDLRMFVTAVVSRLDASQITDTFLQREWGVVANASTEEAEFCIAAATLGFDPYDIDEDTGRTIVEISDSIPPVIRREFFNVANHDQLRGESEAVTEAVAIARANRADLRPLRALRESVSSVAASNGNPPWASGYSSAQQLRTALSIGVQPIRSLGDLAEALRLDESSFRESIVDQPREMHAYEAVVATNQNSSPAFTVSPKHDAARRFQICRGLYEFLSQRDDGPWLVTTGLSDRQKRNRAFAAEFLAPAAGIRDLVSSSIVSSEEVDDLAEHFGVSAEAIVHQLANHRIASVAW